jgi:hypothetical protein
MAQTGTNSLQDVFTSIAQDGSIPADAKARLIADLHAIPTPLQTDPWIYRMVVLSLGITVISSVIGALLITGISAADIPQGVVALGSTAVGALAGLLAPSPIHS